MSDLERARLIVVMMQIVRFVARHPLTRNAKLEAFHRVLTWQVRSRLSDRVEVPWVAGTKLVARRGMTGATGNIYCGLHEFADMGFLLHLLRPGDLFADVGANVGSYTVLASGVCKARSASFEPDPETAAHLRANITANAIDQVVSVHEVALGASEGEVGFTVGLDTINKVTTSDEANSRIVAQGRLDDFVSTKPPTLIKIDVEGYEEEVLKGAPETLANDTLLAVELETTTEWIKEELARHGFMRMNYDPFRRLLTTDDVEYPSSNALFIKNEAAVRRRCREADKIRILNNLL